LQACKLVFSSCQLQPMGSYPRVCDKKGSHDLFGPASKLYCVDFDRAVCLYLACLKVSLVLCYLPASLECMLKPQYAYKII
jgi:hypothetical protein